MTSVEIVKNICKTRKIPLYRLEKDLGYSNGYIGQLRKGVFPSDRLIEIANYLNVPVALLLGHVPDNVAGVAVSRPVVTINVYGTIPAGIPVEAIEDVIDTEQIPAEWLSGGKEYFSLKVKGDSMYPVYLDGDIVIVRKQTTCRTGDDCVVYVNGFDATLKRVKLHDDGGIEIIPLNTNYAPRTYSRAEAEQLPISIGGVVVELRRKIQ